MRGYELKRILGIAADIIKIVKPITSSFLSKVFIMGSSPDRMVRSARYVLHSIII